ncbi:LOW QUALITY PROTEIN: partitioning defective 3 homolog [Pollicipes pollicipes]|uniref:LOW QUALITY PROTEIN: partitioning defective 3 homolog n=1 Tax=Pollicipes pollicipes TaxID=41117 RepID=UPI001884E08B|nr:LOW QUALITY PROTEIN: partitioning defective 3 homolog [Pollicipes pollicipes]
MKVTVCFKGVRVVVPCGSGNGSVRDLMLRSAARYKKATGRPSDSWVTVHSLKSVDGGLLDPDDRLSDVADDREQIVAVYEEHGGRAAPHGGGDGTSGSSDGTASPVPLTGGDHDMQRFSRMDIEVSGQQAPACSLQVRRGSEPALNQVCPLPQFPPDLCADASKRWSAAPIIDNQIVASSTPIKDTSFEQLTPPGEREEASGDERDRPPFSRLARDANRLSMQVGGNSDGIWRWAEAADRLVSPQTPRWEPVGGSNGSPDVSYEDTRWPPPQQQQQQQLVVLTDVSGPLGIHVVPECDESGRDAGLHVQRVEPDGAVRRDGRVSVGDRIVQINGHSLRNISFQRAQEIFVSAMSGGDLRLLVEHVPGRSQPPAPAAALSRSHTPIDALDGDARGGGSRVATVSPTKKVPASLSSRTQSVMQTSNTRKLGRRLSVALVKGADGLGFSVTTRDNPAGAHAPVYVKNILPQGAAVEDGRLRPGDRLLEIDGVAVTGLSQRQVVHMLRAVRPAQPVELVLSRHQEDASPKLPRPLPADHREPDESEPSRDKEVLVFDIPVHDSERAGLGISVKGKTTAGHSGPLDVGIYIKNVIHGGAASKDGRLQRNDQLIDVNYTALLGLSNSDAMETLRRAMCQEGPKSGVITLTVARRGDLGGGSGRESVNSMLSNSSGEVLAGWRPSSERDQSGHSEESQVTVIHRPPPPPPPSDGHGPGPGADRHPRNIRNDSYYQATHDTWDASALQQAAASPAGERPVGCSPTVDAVSVEAAPGGPGSAAATAEPFTHAAYASQTSLEQAGVGFTRDQLGRQSISEKRHASKDAKGTDTYQRTKRAREEREQQRRLLEAELRREEARRRDAGELGPSLGMKKSSSLESLQTMVHELSLVEDSERPFAHRAAAQAVRGRGCNESFRAAVDRSYEAPLANMRDRMETLPLAADADFVTYLVDEEAAPGFNRDRAARQSSMSSGAADDKKAKRRSGLLKGLGSMFRFGRHRKGGEAADAALRLTPDELRQQQEELNRIAARRRAEEHDPT